MTTAAHGPTATLEASLTPEAVAQFKAIYREEFGTDLTDQEARTQAANLIRGFWAVLGNEVGSNRVLFDDLKKPA